MNIYDAVLDLENKIKRALLREAAAADRKVARKVEICLQTLTLPIEVPANIIELFELYIDTNELRKTCLRTRW